MIIKNFAGKVLDFRRITDDVDDASARIYRITFWNVRIFLLFERLSSTKIIAKNALASKFYSMYVNLKILS